MQQWHQRNVNGPDDIEVVGVTYIHAKLDVRAERWVSGLSN